MDDFLKAFQIVINVEKGFQDDPGDGGNWTGGAVNRGLLRGTKYGISAACLHPDTRVLMRDLSWRKNGDLIIGDEVIGFVSNAAKRGLQLEPASVLAINEMELPSLCIETTKREIIASKEHLWWMNRPRGTTARDYQWMMSCDLRTGDEIAQYREPWQYDDSPGAQWLAGMLDGEGCLSENALTLYQNEGVVAQRLRTELSKMGMQWSEDERPPSKLGSAPNICFRMTGCAFQIVGTLRPSRMLEKAERFWRGRCTHGRYNRIETVKSISDVGVRPVMAMITSSGTFIAEGLMSHNSYPTEDIINLTIERAQFLYKRDYWDADRCGEFLWPLSLYLFDDAVNSGQRTAIRQLQTVLGATVDGVVGQQTILLAKSMGSELEAEFLASRIFDETKNPVWPTYGHGWAKRIVLLAMQK
jgi:lysozyme family protein